MNVLPRTAWGAQFPVPAGRHVPLSSRRVVMIHWPGGTASADPVANLRAIERFHVQQQGWASIGYNAAVSRDGRAWWCAGRDQRGIHAGNATDNVAAFGVVALISIGETPPPALLAGLRGLYDQLNHDTGRRLAQTWHGAAFPTACPGPYLTTWVRAGMPGRPTITLPPPREDRNMVLFDPVTGGVWVTYGTGAVHTHRGAPFLGATNNPTHNPGNRPCVGIAARPDNDGYILCLDFGDVTPGQDRFRLYDFPRDGSGRTP